MKIQKKSGRRFLRSQWGYSESAVIVCGVVAAGFLLQLTIGGFDFRLLAFPVNLIAGCAIISACVVMACIAEGRFGNGRLRRGKGSLDRGYCGRFVKWFTGVPFSVVLICALLVLVLVMGLTLQREVASGGAHNFAARLGFDTMSSSWAFVLVYFVVLLSPGTLIARRFVRFRWDDRGFYMNHLGVWLVLFASGPGYADTERYMMYMTEGAVESKAYDIGGDPLRVPLAVRLTGFEVEYYPSESEGVPPEPRRFISAVEVTDESGFMTKGSVEVNHPMRAGRWKIYQSGYDTTTVPGTTYSVLELVRDPWGVFVYTGFVMIALGAAAMVWKGAKR